MLLVVLINRGLGVAEVGGLVVGGLVLDRVWAPGPVVHGAKVDVVVVAVGRPLGKGLLRVAVGQVEVGEVGVG